MEPNEKDILLIENYLDGSLDDDAKKAFEQRLESDHNFANSFQLRKKMGIYVQEASEYAEVRSEVADALATHKSSNFRFSRTVAYSVAASIILLAGIFIVLQFTIFKSGQDSVVLADSNDSTEMLHMDTPKEYATKVVSSNGITLLKPGRGEVISKDKEIMFQWSANLGDSAILILVKSEMFDPVFITAISLKAGHLNYSRDLGPGNYTWYINDTLSMVSFSVE